MIKLSPETDMKKIEEVYKDLYDNYDLRKLFALMDSLTKTEVGNNWLNRMEVALFPKELLKKLKELKEKK